MKQTNTCITLCSNTLKRGKPKRYRTRAPEKLAEKWLYTCSLSVNVCSVHHDTHRRHHATLAARRVLFQFNLFSISWVKCFDMVMCFWPGCHRQGLGSLNWENQWFPAKTHQTILDFENIVCPEGRHRPWLRACEVSVRGKPYLVDFYKFYVCIFSEFCRLINSTTVRGSQFCKQKGKGVKFWVAIRTQLLN